MAKRSGGDLPEYSGWVHGVPSRGVNNVMSRILTELVGATTRVDTSINVVLNEGDRLGIAVARTDITKRGSSSALRIESV
jgi:hypothetical protein